jgi:transposase
VLKVRKIITASSNIAVQVVSRSGRHTNVIKHVGSAKNETELENLTKLAYSFISSQNKNLSLFTETSEFNNHNLVSIDNLRIVDHKHTFAYEFLSNHYKLNGFYSLGNSLLKNLSIMRIIEPTSKIRSIKLLNRYFGIKYTKNTLYKNLPLLNKLKLEVEKIAVSYAKKHLSFDFTLVFFDVTTLYFETFKEDEEGFRKPGFSKDNKPNQPQVLVSLVVTSEGYPIAADVFKGNKFEGHTIIPVIENFKSTHNIKNLTVVADAGMLSLENTQKLKNKGLNYIVGARVSNLPTKQVKEVSGYLDKKESIYFQTETGKGTLVCDYSVNRASKNRSDRKKQVQKALDQINNPGRSIKRLKYVKQVSKIKFTLNKELIEKQEALDGIKGYYTNLKEVSPKLIISRYKDLWNVEKSFRIAKSDLLARPIFHHKKESIKAHILIVFVALAVTKSIEIKTGKSIKRVRDEIWEILDIHIKDSLTGKEHIKRSEY